MNKSVQELKVEVESIKKIQMEATLEMKNLGKRSGIVDPSITNRIQEIEDRISGIRKNTLEDIDTSVVENSKYKNHLTENIQEIQDTSVFIRVLLSHKTNG